MSRDAAVAALVAAVGASWIDRPVAPEHLAELTLERLEANGWTLAPAASEPGDAADLWTRLANDIRAVDGNHDLGAGGLAHRLVERGWTLAPAVSETPERTEARRVAAAILDRRSADPDDDLAILARQFVRCDEARSLAPAASETSLDALYERVAAMLCQHVADAEAHETTSEAIDDWHGVTARTIVSIVRATPPDPPT